MPTKNKNKTNKSPIKKWNTYYYNMIVYIYYGELYCIHWLSWTKVQEMSGIQTDIERDLVEEKHQSMSTNLFPQENLWTH